MEEKNDTRNILKSDPLTFYLFSLTILYFISFKVIINFATFSLAHDLRVKIQILVFVPKGSMLKRISCLLFFKLIQLIDSI